MKRFPLFLCLVLLLVVVTIPVAATTPIIYSLSPATWPNNGDATIAIPGEGFTSGSSVWISSCSTGEIVHGTVTTWSSTSLTATFNLINVKPGAYNVYDISPFYDQWGHSYTDAFELPNGFTIYQGTGTTYATTTPYGTSTGTTTVTTAVTSSQGKNSIFCETNPAGATIFIDGVEVGTSAFTYYTDKDGTFNVLAKKLGYEDYEGKVTVVDGGPRVRFYGVLTQLSSTTNGNTTANTSVSSSPAQGKNTTAIQKSTLKIPTPLGTDPPVTEESPADPALALGAAGIAIGFVLLRRR